MWFILNTYFPSGSLEFGYVLSRGGLHDKPPPIKALGTENLMNYPGKQHLTCCHNSLQGELSASCMTSLGKDSWKFEPGFLQTLPHLPFPFADFGLYLLAVINHNHECDYMLSHMSPSSKSQNIGIVLRICTTTPQHTFL